MKKTILSLLLIAFANVSFAAASSHAVVQIAAGHVNQEIKIYAIFHYKVKNETNSFQQYFGYELLEVNGQAQVIPISFYLENGKVKHVFESKIFKFKFNNTGKFVTKATIKIIGNPSTEDSGLSFVRVFP